VNDDGTAPEEGLDDRKIVAFVETKLDEARRSTNRVSSEAIWLTNTAWLLGYTNAVWDSQTRAFKSAPTSAFGRRMGSKLQTNRILPTIQNRTARLCKMAPRYEVKPNSNNVGDKDAAKLAESIINHYWDLEKIQRKRIDLTMWKQQCGHAYLKVVWDSEKGKTVSDPTTGETIKSGDLRIDIAPAFEVYPDPAAKTLEECAYLIHTKIRPLTYFIDHYGEELGGQVKQEDVTLLGLQYQTRINALNTKTEGDGASGSVKNSAVEKIYYEKSCAKYPNGRMIATANGIKLEDKDLPVGEIPFVKFDDILIGGKYNSEAVITHMRPLQGQLNRLLNQRDSWIRLCMHGKFSVARGAGISQEAMNDQDGEIVEYDPVPNDAQGGRPQPLPVPIIPASMYTEEDRILNGFYEIAGISDVARGQIPSASIPAAGMSILLEADATRIGIMVESDEHAFADLGRLILLYVQKFKSIPSLLKQSSNQGYLVTEFKGADLKDNTDVVVRRGSMIPDNTSMKRQDTLNVYERGLLGDPADPAVREKVLGMLEFGEIAEAWKDQSLDEMQVKKVIEKIEMGMEVMPSEFDNAPYWLKEMNRYRKSEKFDMLDPIRQAMFMKTMELCITNIMPPGMKAPAAPVVEGGDSPMMDEPMDETQTGLE